MSKQWELRIEADAFDGTRCWLVASIFRMLSEGHGFAMDWDSVAQSTAELADDWNHHRMKRFSTLDESVGIDAKRCVGAYKGGWWYANCGRVFLNGEYQNKGVESFTNISVYHFKQQASLKRSRMMFRPQNDVRPCNNPCKNGGTCDYRVATESARCRCVAEFSGPTCEDTLNDPENGAGSDADSVADIDAHNDTVSDADSDAGSDAGSDANSGVHSGTASDTYSAADSDAHNDTVSDAYSNAHSDAYSGAHSDSQNDTVSAADSDADSDVDSVADSDVDSAADSDADSDADSGAHSDAHSDVDSAADSDADSDADSGAHSDAHSDVDSAADTDADSGADADANSGSGGESSSIMPAVAVGVGLLSLLVLIVGAIVVGAIRRRKQRDAEFKGPTSEDTDSDTDSDANSDADSDAGSK